MAPRGWRPTLEAAAGRLSSGEEKARSARRQPSLWQRTPLAPTYSRRRAPRDPLRLAPARSPTPGMTQTQPPGRMSQTAALIGPPGTVVTPPEESLSTWGGPAPSLRPCLCVLAPPGVSGGGRWGPSPGPWRSSGEVYR